MARPRTTKAIKPGDVIGQWEVLKFSDRGKYKYYWKCRCLSCGVEKDVNQGNLAHGRSKSCLKCGTRTNLTHGMSNTRVYCCWENMKSRCENERSDDYHNYGGRGIKLCKRWADFSLFHADMGDPPTDNHSLDRIDVNGDYEPGNVRWASPAEQARNKRNNRFITYDNKTMCVEDWAKEVGFSSGAIISGRIKMGWSVEDSLTRPVAFKRRKKKEG